MEQIEGIKILFIAGFGPIVRETSESRRLYRESLGINFKEESGGYLHTETIPATASLLRGHANSFATLHAPCAEL
jgi:hypothetical protein